MSAPILTPDACRQAIAELRHASRDDDRRIEYRRRSESAADALQDFLGCHEVIVAYNEQLRSRLTALESLLAEKQRQCDVLTDACERALMVIESASPSHPETVATLRAALAERRSE